MNAYAIDWVKDIDVYHDMLEKNHVDLYHNIKKDEFKLKLDAIKINVPNLTDFQVKVALMRLTREVGGGKGDGHTSIPLWNSKLHRFPIEVINFAGELRVVKAYEEHIDLLGGQIVAINETPIEEIIAEISAIVPFTENKYSNLTRTSSYLLISEVLHSLGFTDKVNQAIFALKYDDGTVRNIELNSVADNTINPTKYREIKINAPVKSDLDHTKLDGLWFSFLPDKKAVYIKYTAYPSFEEMDAFARNLIKTVSTTDTRNLIIDLRDNYGGDLFTGLFLASYLNTIDQMDWKNGVFVLTNRKTFSAAAVNSSQFRQLLNAKIIGEPTGGNPNGPQDMGSFTLPDSGLLVTYSKRIFRMQDINTNGVQPDIPVDIRWEDYKAGFDRVLSTVYDHISIH